MASTVHHECSRICPLLLRVTCMADWGTWGCDTSRSICMCVSWSHTMGHVRDTKMQFDKVKLLYPLQITTLWLMGYLSVRSPAGCTVVFCHPDCLTLPYLCDIWLFVQLCTRQALRNSSSLSHTPQAAPDGSYQSTEHLIDILFPLIKTR